MEQVRAVLIAAKQKKAQDTLIALQREDIIDLRKQVATLYAKDSTNREISEAYRSTIATMQEQRGILEKEVRKWKLKTRWTAISGVALTGLVTFLFITK